MAEIDFPDTLVDLCSEHVFPVSPAFFASPVAILDCWECD